MESKKSILAWILGKGGLLGAHLAKALQAHAPVFDHWSGSIERFSWHDRDSFSRELEHEVRTFANLVRFKRCPWSILWAASAGVIGSSAASLSEETFKWQRFLELLNHYLPIDDPTTSGSVFFASSAGGVYGGQSDIPVTEASVAMPLSEYGKAKLQQERVLIDWASDRAFDSYLIGRISNLYGIGQNLTKPQGLISHLSRSLIYNWPVHIYVPLDTLRDYVMAGDCADHIVKCLDCLHKEYCRTGQPAWRLKIIAAEQSVSIASLIGIFAQLTNRHPKVVCGSHDLGRQHARKVSFRSTAWPEVGALRCASLVSGIHQVHQHHLLMHGRGLLPAPGALAIHRNTGKAA
jgi:UDP-glucose 4-epimerase